MVGLWLGYSGACWFLWEWIRMGVNRRRFLKSDLKRK